MGITIEEIEKRTQQKHDGTGRYTGPTTFEGNLIPYDVSPNITVGQIIRQLDRSGFASVNIIGIPGCGKSVTANMIAHLIHTQRPEFTIIWAGSNELRKIKNFLEELPKGFAYILIFDDTSNALDSLSGEELSEAFQSYTRGRHEVQGKICPIMIYHYSKSHKKNFRAMALFNIYLSATATERGNIKELIRGDNKASNKFRQFQNLFRTSFGPEKSFDYGGLHFEDSNPFRIAYVLGPLGTNIMFTKELKCAYCQEKSSTEFIPPDKLMEVTKHAYPNTWNGALSLLCYMKGEKDALGNDLRSALDFGVRALSGYSTDFRELGKKLRQERKQKKLRYYHKHKEENEAFNELQKHVIKKITDERPVELKISLGLEGLFPQN